jgi:hypothetical protein
MACYDVISQIVANHIFGDSSSDETVDEELSDTETLLTFHVLSGTEPHPKSKGYLELISQMNDCDFWRTFRVSRESFKLITDFLSNHNCEPSQQYHGGPKPLTVNEMAYITLEYIGNQGSIRLWSFKYNRAESTIWSTVKKVQNNLNCQSCFWTYTFPFRFVSYFLTIKETL